MLAAMARLSEVYPAATIRGFSLLRSMSSEPITQIKEPCEGTIRLVSWGTQRDP